MVSTLLDRRWGCPRVNAGRPGTLTLAARGRHTDVNAGTRPSPLFNAIIIRLPANPAAGGPERRNPTLSGSRGGQGAGWRYGWRGFLQAALRYPS